MTLLQNYNLFSFEGRTSLSDIIFTIVPLLIFGVIILIIVTAIFRFLKNSTSPQITAIATVSDKRTEVRGDHSYSYYYVTFEYESGDRQEFQVKSSDFGLISIGDVGTLKFQGTRYLGFERYK